MIINSVLITQVPGKRNSFWSYDDKHVYASKLSLPIRAPHSQGRLQVPSFESMNTSMSEWVPAGGMGQELSSCQYLGLEHGLLLLGSEDIIWSRAIGNLLGPFSFPIHPNYPAYDCLHANIVKWICGHLLVFINVEAGDVLVDLLNIQCANFQHSLCGAFNKWKGRRALWCPRGRGRFRD